MSVNLSAANVTDLDLPLEVADALGRHNVEDAATGEVLARLGCDVAQGFAVARPMPVEQFLGWPATPQPFLLDEAQRTA